MIEWTEGAKVEWKNYCSRVRDALAGSGADADEVIEDMYRGLTDKLAESKLQVVTEAEMKKITNQFGFPDRSQEIDNSNDMPSLTDNVIKPYEDPKFETPKKAGSFCINTFGIVLPIITLFVELTTRICTFAFFDPIPTFWHIILLAIVPLSILFSLSSIANGKTERFKMLGYLNALAIGIATIYTLFFIPLLPISVMAILAFGLGFCSLSPILSLFALIAVRKRLKIIMPEQFEKVPGLLPGLLASLICMILAVLPSTLARVGIEMATANDVATQARGIKLLRMIKSDESLLEYCYRRVNGMTDLATSIIVPGDPASPEEVRGVYYRVTGKPYNSSKPPSNLFSRGNVREDFWFDSDQGESHVGAQIEGLTLQSSLMDGSIDADSALGYLEWTMVFKNSNNWQQREARANIQLPTGAVVSRLTLWVNGEEREAAFASRSRTKQAYQSVVLRRRDPVLVTTEGPDRIMVQCFPVPPKGGLMKIRVGMTVPLNLISEDTALLKLPYFNSRNFIIPQQAMHSIWLESDQKINTEIKELENESPADSVYAIRGELSDDQLSKEQGLISFARDPERFDSWCEDPVHDGTFIKQTINKTTLSCPEQIVLVVDSSVGMKPLLKDISETVKFLPKAARVSLIIADDTVQIHNEIPKATTEEFRLELANQISRIKTRGGKDNIPALKEAWDIASKSENSVILWLYSGQPYIFDSPDTLLQRWNRRPNGPKLIQAQVLPGVDEVTKSFDSVARISSLVSTGNIKNDLQRLFESWDGNPAFVIERNEIPSNLAQDSDQKTSDHLARLYSYDNIKDLLVKNEKDFNKQALEIAASYQLVTSVSGAVVLESQSQYEAAGLQPVDSETVPTIPEPEVWALMIIVFTVLCWVVIKKRSKYRLAC